MSGSTIGGVVGGVIGFWVGGPQGAQIGFMLGSAVGGYLDPQHIKGPSLGDIPVQTSQEGVPRPIVYGAPQPFPGNIIQMGPQHRVIREEEQGKGGPVVEHEEVYQSYAIRICEGPATVLQIFRDGKLVFDRTGTGGGILDADSAVFASKIALYTGDETQLPDPTLESLPAANGGGAGNVPAYRGTAYMVVANDNLTNTGGRIPQYTFRMASNATLSDTCESEGGLIAWWPLDDTSPGGVAREVVQGANGVYVEDTETLASGPALNIASAGSTYFGDFGDYMVADGFPVESVSTLDAWTVSCWCKPTDINGGDAGKIPAYYSTGDFITGANDWGLMFIDDLDNMTPIGAVGTGEGSSSETIESSSPASVNQVLFMLMTWEKNEGDSLGTRRLYINGALVATQTDISNSNRTGQYMIAGGGYGFPDSTQFIGYVSDIKVYNYALSAQEVSDKYVASSGDFIEAPDQPGTYIGIDGTIYNFCAERATAGAVYLSEVELDLADRVGVDASKMDVSADTAVEVEGFLIGKQMPAREAMRVLGTAYFRDYPEYDLQIHSKPRGGASVATLTDDDFVASDEDSETRRQPIELPRKLNLYFSDPSSNYAVVPVPAERTSTNVPSTSVVGVELPMVFARNVAAQKADILLRVMWEEAQGTLVRDLPAYEFAYLTAADPIRYDDKRWRIEKIEHLDGVIRIEAKRDRVANYVSNSTANTPVSPTDPVVNLKGPSILKAMNLPRLTTNENQAGMYLAVTGLLEGWPGAHIYLSTDNGATEQRVATILSRATIGRLSDAVDADDTVMQVETFGTGELASISAAQLAAGQNAFALSSADSVGTDWEVCQFQTAQEDSNGGWDVSDILRGQLETTAVAHASEDDFVLLDSAIRFLPIDVRHAGKTLIFRAVTIGTPNVNNDTISVVFDPQFTGPVTFDFYTDASGEKYYDANGAYYYRE